MAELSDRKVRHTDHMKRTRCTCVQCAVCSDAWCPHDLLLLYADKHLRSGKPVQASSTPINSDMIGNKRKGSPPPASSQSSAPKKPKAASPKKPKAASPKKPKAALPKKPTAALPKKPKAVVHKKPKAASPEATVPKKSNAVAPKNPKATVPPKAKAVGNHKAEAATGSKSKSKVVSLQKAAPKASSASTEAEPRAADHAKDQVMFGPRIEHAEQVVEKCTPLRSVICILAVCLHTSCLYCFVP